MSSAKIETVSERVKGKDEDPEGKEYDAKDRGQWDNQLEFILTCVGYAVGLGNVWRFPYLCFKHGGGAFLVPYVLMLALCGMPVFFMEISFGQFASLGPLAIWEVNPLFKGIGISMVTVSVFVGLYYDILIVYILFFFFASMNTEVPWQDCENHWNTYECITTEQLQDRNATAEYLEKYNMTAEDIKTPSEEYFYNEVLKISPGIEVIGGVVWELACCLVTTWIIVFLVLLKGIGSLGKVVYFTSTFPYIMMLIMVVRGCTLEGSGFGIEYYLKPDFSKLNNAQVWSDAASQIFYSLSTCSGGLIAMASYNKFKNNTYRDALMIPLINCGTSLFAGFAIFGVLGYLARAKDVEIEDVAASGPGLIFVVYPEGLSMMPGAPVWSVLFFLMMLVLGFSSQFSIVECVFVALMDQFPSVLRSTPNRPVIFRAVTITVYILISLPMVCEGGFYLFNILDNYAGGLPRLFIGVLELIGVIWIYGLGRFSSDIEMMIGHKPNIYFRACWTVISPVLVTFIILAKCIQHEILTLGDYTYPKWADTMGWLCVVTVVMWLPIWMVIQWIKDGGWEIVKRTSKPTSAWGPANPEDRTGRYQPEVRKFREEQEDMVHRMSKSNGSIIGLDTVSSNGHDSELGKKGSVLGGFNRGSLVIEGNQTYF